MRPKSLNPKLYDLGFGICRVWLLRLRRLGIQEFWSLGHKGLLGIGFTSCVCLRVFQIRDRDSRFGVWSFECSQTVKP